jgi:hypothetical protein
VPARGVTVQDRGLWLLARLAVHHEYNRVLPKKRQDPIPGLGFLGAADALEVARLEVELAKLRHHAEWGPPAVPVTYMRRAR